MERIIEHHEDGTLTLTLEGYSSVKRYTTHVPCALLMQNASDERCDDVVLVTVEKPVEGVPEAALFVFKDRYESDLKAEALACMADQWRLTPEVLLTFAAHNGIVRSNESFRDRFMPVLVPLTNSIVLTNPVDEGNDDAPNALLTYSVIKR